MIQIDMPKPTNCYGCIACNEYLMCAIPVNGRGWGENDVKDFEQGIPEWCPMKELEAVKPIEEFIKSTNCHYYHCKSCGNIVGTIFDDKHPIFPGVKVSIKHFCDACGQKVKWND